MTFKEYLKNLAKKDGKPIYDFAKDIMRDSEFPDTITHIDSLRFYLILKRACPEALAAGTKCFNNYKNKLKRVSHDL